MVQFRHGNAHDYLSDATKADLQRLSAKEGRHASDYAARLLARSVRAARPRPVFDETTLKAYAAENAAEEALAKPVYDIKALKAAYAEFADEDVALSEATLVEHAELLWLYVTDVQYH